jgi:hypothetical protein
MHASVCGKDRCGARKKDRRDACKQGAACTKHAGMQDERSLQDVQAFCAPGRQAAGSELEHGLEGGKGSTD